MVAALPAVNDHVLQVKLAIDSRHMLMCLKWGSISMVVICYGRDAIGYSRRILELSNATLHMK